MVIKYFGQNCFKITIGDLSIISDPAITANPIAKHVNMDELVADYILVTHAHQDHTNDVEKVAIKNGAKIIANFEIASHYGSKGFNYHPMNHGGKWQFRFGTLAMVSAIHTSTFPDGTNGGNPAGFVLITENKRIYLAGDTALTYDMQLIPRLYGQIDLAILPIGDNFTMGINEAIVAAEFVQCEHVLGCHYDSFPYIEINKEDAREKFSNAGIHLTLLDIGSEMKL